MQFGPKSRLAFGALVAAVVVLLATAPAQEKRITLYSPQTTYSLDLTDRDGVEYVGLLELLEPLGSTTARLDGKKWRLHFNDIEGQFTAGASKCKLRGKDVELTSKFVVESGRGYVPVRSLMQVLPHFLGSQIEFREGSRRLFVGGAATRFNTELKKGAPSRLVLNFTAPVNPFVATEPGRLHMVFRREPVRAPDQPTQNFDDKLITSAVFAENNGAAELNVLASEPLLATFSNGGKTITITAAPSAAAPKAAPRSETTAQAPPPPPPPQHNGSSPRRFVVVLDAAHGGDDRGAVLAPDLAEKDATLVWARRLRSELANHGIATTLLRDSDASLGFDQRATATNTARASVYISLHAVTTGAGIRVYTALLSPTSRKATAFLPWDSAQAVHLGASQTLAQNVVSEMTKRSLRAAALSAPVRPLNNIATTAIAVEIAQGSTPNEVLSSAPYQQAVSSAIAGAVAALKPKEEAH